MMMQLSTACALLGLATSVFAIPATPVAPRHSPSSPQTSVIAVDFLQPWAFAFLPDNRILVTERNGSLRLVNPVTGAKGHITGVPTVSWAGVTIFGQGGLGDVVLHPKYHQNKLVYISYAEPGTNTLPPDAVVARAVVARGKLVLNNSGGGSLQNVQVIWRQSEEILGDGHFGHRILFHGRNDTLFITSGDRQQFDPAQSPTSNLGKIIRLHDDGSVPSDNPFFSSGGVTAQIWASGIRNPYGIDFDQQGRLWEIEMGPFGGDEFNLIQKGANYGWPIVSNGDHYDGTPIPNHDTRPEFNAPKVWWAPVISPAGLIIYKGKLFKHWKGNALIAGLGAQGLVRVQIYGNNTAAEVERIPLGQRIRGVREGPGGAIYVIEDGPGGRLLKLTP
ncbi:Glucose/Sorbosone dehydrogenase [Podospora fimiseda]|uniref:Glucose/Sorbosone dehydrogenase n=1 Tax=Podospora fimiseda TaxID=252190 RepID=A0AAN7GP34_9PEZI|nr:Glucose/Sorbosone dehydrogenase [Podospora fimiseda]